LKTLRPLAIYLPQFHPIPENNEWWGKGFTEWRNVTKCTPRFQGHYQPHLPADIGFYDLRLHTTLIEQAKLAKEYGIEGFCFYHYWFNGRRVLETPVDNMLAAGTPDFPFCLCWANENWTRRWDGMEGEILLKQEYSDDDDRAHISALKKYFQDSRYIRVDGKPVFIVYRPSLFPDIRKTTETWRAECRNNGVGEIYLMYMQSFKNYEDPAVMGFDAAVEFQPDFWNFPEPTHEFDQQESYFKRLFYNKETARVKNRHDRIFTYDAVMKRMMQREKPPYKRYPGVFPMWDNAARREKGATIIHGSEPQLYEKWLKDIVANFKPYSGDENFIFINAWNEWAEGNHLEPCQKWGRAYLEATQRSLTDQ